MTPPAEQVAFSSTGDWDYPRGTVLIKHFEPALDEADPTNTTRLETRFLVLGDDREWYGLTYRWRASQTDADLLTTDETRDNTIQLSGGGARRQTRYFPSRVDCLICHRPGASGALGLSTHQLNRDFTYASAGQTDNQLRTWNDLGMFSPSVDEASIPTFLTSPALGNVTAPLQDRARSWLDSSCGYCHRPGGANARFTTPFFDQHFLWTGVRDAVDLPDGLTLDHDSGAICWTLVSPGVHTITVSASDGPNVSIVSFTCQLNAPFCGNGVLDTGEECDDGNIVDSDSCTSECVLEPAPMPDGGTPDGGVPDAGVPSGGMPDGGELVPNGSSGGGCSVRSGKAPVDLSALLSTFALMVLRRRRHDRY